MYRFRFVAITLLALTPYAVASAADRETQYVCIFQAKVQMTNFSPSSPRTEIQDAKGKYTFFDNGTTNGAYISLSLGVKRPAVVIHTKGYVAFTEDLSGYTPGAPSNHFVMTIFTSERYGPRYRAVMSVHSAGDSDLIYPSQAIGECTRI